MLLTSLSSMAMRFAAFFRSASGADSGATSRPLRDAPFVADYPPPMSARTPQRRSLHSVRIRHGVACIKAARLSAACKVAIPRDLTALVRTLDELSVQLSDDRADDRHPALELIEVELASIERQLNNARRRLRLDTSIQTRFTSGSRL